MTVPPEAQGSGEAAPGGDLQQFTASDGAHLAYSDEGTGRPLLLLHGLMAHSGFFSRQRELVRDFRLVVPDLRGHGRSPDRAPTVERLAADMSELAELLDLEDAIGVGWSLGASVLWHILAGPASPRFGGAVIVDMTPRVLNGEGWDLGLSPRLCEERSAAIRGDFGSFAMAAGQAIFSQALEDGGRELARWSGAEFARNDPLAIDALWRSLVDQDFRPVLGGISQPSLVIYGAQSHLYGSDTAHHLVAALPNARAVQFDRSGHAPHMEQPALFNRTILDFAAGLPRTAQSVETMNQA